MIRAQHFLLALIIILVLIDSATTYVALTHSIAHEANPVLAYAINQLGTNIAIIISAITRITLSLIAYRYNTIFKIYAAITISAHLLALLLPSYALYASLSLYIPFNSPSKSISHTRDAKQRDANSYIAYIRDNALLSRIKRDR